MLKLLNIPVVAQTVWSGPPFFALCVYRGESAAHNGRPGPLALGRTRQVAPHFITLVMFFSEFLLQ